MRAFRDVQVSILSFVFFCMLQSVLASPVVYTIESQDLPFNKRGCKGPCAVGFEIGYTMGTHEGFAREIQGRVKVEFAPSFTITEAEFVIPVTSMTTGKIALRDQHMRETLGAEQFPFISFKLTSPISAEGIARVNPGDELKVPASGIWTMHGVSREVSIPLKIKFSRDSLKSALVRADFELDNSAYGIKRYSYLGLTVDDISKVSLNLPMQVRASLTNR